MKSTKHYLSAILMMLFIALFASAATVSAATPKPAKVATIKASASGRTAKVSWSKTSNAYRYVLYQVNAEGKTTKKLTTTSKTTVTLKNLKEGTTYNFRVRAYNKKKVNGEFSDIATITIAVSKPGAPKNFSLSSYGNKSVNLKWSKVSGVTGYILYQYDEATSTYKQIKTISSSSKKYTLSGLKEETTYKFMLKSYKKINGEMYLSSESSIVTAKIPTVPAEVLAVRKPRFTTKLKSDQTLKTTTGETVVLKKNSSLAVNSKYGTTVTGYLSNGQKVTVKRSTLKYTGLDSSAKNDYSTSVKQQFVNYKGLKSSSKYLIWVSEYKLKINIFKGSQGNWKLVKSYPCVIGKWQTRTAPGLKKILKKVRYGVYGGPDIAFSPGSGTNSNPQGCRFHHYVDGKRNQPASHGCVRTSQSALMYIYNNCPIGTTVYVY